MLLENDIILIGPMGSGKSTVAHALARLLAATPVDLDAVIEKEAGKTISAIFEAEGEAGFRLREHQALQATLGQGRVVATGGGVVLDPRNRMLLRRAQTCIWLDAPTDVLAARLQSEAMKRPLLANENIEAKLIALDRIRRPLYEETAHIRIDTQAAAPDQIAVKIEAALLERT